MDNGLIREQLKITDDLISKQNYFIDNYGVLFSVLTVIIGLFAIAAPILTYFSSTRPSGKQREEITKRLEKNEAIISKRLENIDLQVERKIGDVGDQISKMESIFTQLSANLDDVIEKRLQGAINNIFNTQIENALNDLYSGKPELISNAATVISLLQFWPSLDDFIDKVYAAYVIAENENVKFMLAQILSRKKSEFGEKLFRGILKEDSIDFG